MKLLVLPDRFFRERSQILRGAGYASLGRLPKLPGTGDGFSDTFPKPSDTFLKLSGVFPGPSGMVAQEPGKKNNCKT
ncbi:MAG: hypothetical protein ABFS16_01520 [Bacteroidota bacterium]